MQKGGMGPTVFSKTSARNYHYLLCNNPEESSVHLLRGGSLKSLTFSVRFKEMQTESKYPGLIKIKAIRIYFPMSSTIITGYFEKCHCLAKKYDMTAFQKPIDSVQLWNKLRDAEFFLQGTTVALHINYMLQFMPRYPKWSLPNI
jgi:hypothetical protein